jgi:NAD(P)-dependent dehydrogenase (short-subunit alcohol dehydrogenase family)
MKKALITGANKSIGLETARQLLQLGYYIYLGSRNLENGLEAVEKLKTEGLTNLEAIQLDVSNDESVKAARVEIGKNTEVLDVLINNAGILGGMSQPTSTDIAVFKQVFDTNLFGVVRVTQAFMDLLQKSTQPRIVNVTSGLVRSPYTMTLVGRTTTLNRLFTARRKRHLTCTRSFWLTNCGIQRLKSMLLTLDLLPQISTSIAELVQSRMPLHV